MAIITIYISKCEKMNPQQLPKTSKFYCKCKKCDIEKTLGVGTTPLGSLKVNHTYIYTYGCRPTYTFVYNYTVSALVNKVVPCNLFYQWSSWTHMYDHDYDYGMHMQLCTNLNRITQRHVHVCLYMQWYACIRVC